MSSRQSKTGSRSSGRARSAGGGKRAGRAAANSSRSLSASRRAASARGRGADNVRRASAARGSRTSRKSATRSRGERRSGSSASYAVKLLTRDHREVERAVTEFESAAREEKQGIARRICRMLTVHAQIEEELLYPAARDALRTPDSHLIAEARVEHASLKDLIGQIEDREQLDEQYEAKVRVLGEYVRHHAGEEEREIFPRLERSSLDLQALGERLEERKRELLGRASRGHDGEALQEEEGMPEGPPPHARSRAGRGHRQGGLHARRR